MRGCDSNYRRRIEAEKKGGSREGRRGRTEAPKEAAEHGEGLEGREASDGVDDEAHYEDRSEEGRMRKKRGLLIDEMTLQIPEY